MALGQQRRREFSSPHRRTRRRDRSRGSGAQLAQVIAILAAAQWRSHRPRNKHSKGMNVQKVEKVKKACFHPSPRTDGMWLGADHLNVGRTHAVLARPASRARAKFVVHRPESWRCIEEPCKLRFERTTPIVSVDQRPA